MDVVADVTRRYRLTDKDNKRQFFEWYALKRGLVKVIDRENLYEDGSMQQIVLDVYGKEFTIEVTNNEFPDGWCIALEEFPEAKALFEQHMNDHEGDFYDFMVSEFD